MTKLLISDTANVTIKRKSDGRVFGMAETQLASISQSLGINEKLYGGIGNKPLAVMKGQKEVTATIRNLFYDQEFLAKYTDRESQDFNYNKNKFGYRLRKDSTPKTGYDTKGVLSFCYDRSATEFQIATSNTVSLTVDGDNGGEWKVSPFAMATGDTLEKLEKLALLGADDGTQFNHAYFRAPLEQNKLITVKSVKVRRKYEPKWADFDFMEYYKTGEDANSRLRIWQTSQRKSGK